MSALSTPHPLNSNFFKLEDYSLGALEYISQETFKKHTKKLEKTFGVNIEYIFNLEEKGNAAIFNIKDVGSSYSLLPIFLATKVKKDFSILFPDLDYPIGVYTEDDCNYSFFNVLPIMGSSNHFSLIANILQSSIEKYINNEFVKYYIKDSDTENLYEIDKNLEKILFSCIHDIKSDKMTISFNEILDEYREEVRRTLDFMKGRGDYLTDYQDKNEDLLSQFKTSQPSLMDLNNIINKLVSNSTVNVNRYLKISKDIDDFQNNDKPKYPSSATYKVYLNEQEVENRHRISNDTIMKNNRN